MIQEQHCAENNKYSFVFSFWHTQIALFLVLPQNAAVSECLVWMKHNAGWGNSSIIALHKASLHYSTTDSEYNQNTTITQTWNSCPGHISYQNQKEKTRNYILKKKMKPIFKTIAFFRLWHHFYDISRNRSPRYENLVMLLRVNRFGEM